MFSTIIYSAGSPWLLSWISERPALAVLASLCCRCPVPIVSERTLRKAVSVERYALYADWHECCEHQLVWVVYKWKDGLLLNCRLYYYYIDHNFRSCSIYSKAVFTTDTAHNAFTFVTNCPPLPTVGVCHPLHADSGCVSPPTPPFADAPDCCNGCSFWCSLFSSVMWKNIAAWLWSQCPKNAANIQMPLLLLGHRFRPRALIEDIITMAMLLHIKYMEDCLKWLELYCNSVYTLNRVVICYLN